jgi:glycosyltransferase involved in cell wall biosynthesis
VESAVHVVFLTQYFTPEVGATQTRIHEFARACVARGHRVTVVTEFPNHPHGRIPPAYRGRWLTREVLDGFTVLRVWVLARPVKTFATRVAFYASFFLLSALRGLAVRGPVDVVFATSPPLPVGLAGWIVARGRRARLVLDIRDLWPAAAEALGELRNPRLLRLAGRLERFLYRHADLVTAVTRGFVRHITGIVDDPARVVWLPNGAAVAVFDPHRTDAALRARLGLEGRFLVTFAGNHGIAQGLDTVLDAAEILRGRAEVVFGLIGDGPVKTRLEERARARGLPNVRFLPAVPLAEITPYLTASDALLVPLRRDPVFDTFIPSKLFDFMACARPVVLMVDGEARETLEASGGGLWAAPGDAEGLAKVVVSLMEMGPAARRRMGERGRAYVLRHFTRDAQGHRLTSLLDALERRR